MIANDLISRSALIAEYDRVHVGPPGGARKLMEEAPAINPEELRGQGKRPERALCSRSARAGASTGERQAERSAAITSLSQEKAGDARRGGTANITKEECD